MTVVAIGLVAAAAVTAAGSMVAAGQAAEGAQNAQATIQGGVSRLNAFRSQIRKDNAVYRDNQEAITNRLVGDVSGQTKDSQAYKDASRRFDAASAATGSVRSGAAASGRSELASREEDAQFARRMAVGQMLQTQTGRADALTADTYRNEASLLGQEAHYQQQEGNAKAAGTEAAAQGISSAISAGTGAYAAGMGGGATSTRLGTQMTSGFMDTANSVYGMGGTPLANTGVSANALGGSTAGSYFDPELLRGGGYGRYSMGSGL